MSTFIKTAAAVALVASATSASAFWGTCYNMGDMANDFFGMGDGTGDFNMNMNARGNGRGWGRGYDRFNAYGYNAPHYGYAPYGYGAPVAAPYGYPLAPAAPVGPQAPVTQ